MAEPEHREIRWSIVLDGRRYDSPKLKKAIDWLNEHPEHMDKTVRAVTEIMKHEFDIGKSTVALAMKAVREGIKGELHDDSA